MAGVTAARVNTTIARKSLGYSSWGAVQLLSPLRNTTPVQDPGKFDLWVATIVTYL